MPSVQNTINFPVRRSRRLSVPIKKYGCSADVDSPSTVRRSRKSVAPRPVSPPSSPLILSPTKRKLHNKDAELEEIEITSPTKQKKVAPPATTLPAASPLPVRRKLIVSDSPPEKCPIVPNNTPIKPLKTQEMIQTFPRRLSAEISLKLSTPVKNDENYRSPLKELSVHAFSNTILKESPQKQLTYASSPRTSPRKSCIIDEKRNKKCLSILSSPSKENMSVFSQNSLRKSDNINKQFLSPKKSQQLTFLSPKKEESLIMSPRRSPRKHTPKKETALSPRRSPRKLLSPSKFSSPSTLISKLSLDSPSALKKSVTVGLHKPDVQAYKTMRQSLSTAKPTRLVCRDQQISELTEFLTDHIEGGKPGSLYVSGPPGTGKTASLTNIMSTLKMKGVRKVFINCMSVRSSNHIFEMIAEGLKIDETTEKENIKAIEKLVTSSKKAVIIILDEIDQLDSKHQSILYTIFEWPALQKSKAVLIGIANALDLTDRILPRLQSCSCKPKVMNFPPYSKADIVQIINDRIKEADLGDVQIIQPAAVQFLAAKVAAVAGDIRKALDVCRRAIELCEVKVRTQAKLTSPSKSPSKQRKMQTVNIPQIHKIFNEVYGSRVMAALTEAPQSFSMQQKILVCSFLLMLKHAKCKNINLGQFHEVFSNVCKKRKVAPVDQSEFLSMCTLLEARGMLQLKKNKDLRLSKVSLKLNAEEAEQALGDRKLLLEIMEDRVSLGKLCSKN